MQRVFADADQTSLRRPPQPNGKHGNPFKRFFREITLNRALYLMSLPAVIFLFINSYLPMFGIIIAFKNINFIDGILGSPWVGLKNFEFLFASRQAWEITRNTILYNIVFIATNLFFGVAFAVALNELWSKKLAKFYQSTLFFRDCSPWLLSVILSIPC